MRTSVFVQWELVLSVRVCISDEVTYDGDISKDRKSCCVCNKRKPIADNFVLPFISSYTILNSVLPRP